MGVESLYFSLEENCENAQVCLDYIDKQLEESSDQTISIAEKLIESIGGLNSRFVSAKTPDERIDVAGEIVEFQKGLISHLQEIILKQASRDLNGQVVIRLNDFVGELKDGKPSKLEVPSHVMTKNDSTGLVSQDEIDSMFD